MTGVDVLTPLLRRVQRTRGRLFVAVGVGAALSLAALAANVGGAYALTIATLLAEPVLTIAVPLTAMIFAVASLGDLRDDETLVYVWLRPIPRWKIATAAVLASVQLAVPLAAGTAAGVALLGGQPALLVPAVLAASLATVAYAGLFVALGLRTSRSLLWGLGYVLLLEGFLSRFADSFAAVSVRRYARSVFSQLADAGHGDREVSLAVAVLALVAIAAAGLALTTRWLHTRDVP